MRAADFAPVSVAASSAPAMSDAEAGAIAAHRQLARGARNALAANVKSVRSGNSGGKSTPQSLGRRRKRKGLLDERAPASLGMLSAADGEGQG